MPLITFIPVPTKFVEARGICLEEGAGAGEERGRMAEKEEEWKGKKRVRVQAHVQPAPFHPTKVHYPFYLDYTLICIYVYIKYI